MRRISLALFATMLLPSIGVLCRFTGLGGLGLYVLAAALWTGFGVPVVVRALGRPRTSPWLALAVLAVGMGLLTAAFAVGYPLANSGRIGPGSDRDEALEAAIDRIARWEHPYRATTYLGNPITPMPGAVLLGAPFRVLFGSVAIQNLAWIFAFFLLLLRASRWLGLAVVLWASFSLLTPEALREFVTGGDFVTNATYVAASSALVVSLAQRSARHWTIGAASAFWGVCLSSRPSYLLVVPLVVALLVRQTGVAVTGAAVVPAAVVWTLLVVPLYALDPPSFTPLQIGRKLTHAEGLTPLASAAGAAALIAAVTAAWRLRLKTQAELFGAASAILALPVPLVVGTALLVHGRAGLVELVYLAPACIFLLVAVAFWLRDRRLAPSWRLPGRTHLGL